jgi:uncharacterized membrane protein YraQ (UPF0718 family)
MRGNRHLAVSAFVSQTFVMRYLGPQAPKPLACGVGSVCGTSLVVCSCTVLPLFAGIYRMGAGLGPATALLYSGPAHAGRRPVQHRGRPADGVAVP